MKLFARIECQKFVLDVENEEIRDRRINKEVFPATPKGVKDLINRARELNGKRLEFSDDLYHPGDFPEIPVQAFNQFLEYMEY